MPANPKAAASTASIGTKMRHQSQPSAINTTPATQSVRLYYHVPDLPRKVKVDVAKCHACHAKSRGVHGVNWDPSAPPEPAQCHKYHACHVKCTSMSPSVIPATQSVVTSCVWVSCVRVSCVWVNCVVTSYVWASYVWASYVWVSYVWVSCVVISCVWVSCVCKLCGDKLCVSKLCVSKLCGDKLCVSKLCGDKLCVSKLCVNKYVLCGKKLLMDI